MSGVQYSYADPEEVKSVFGEYDVVDFMINTSQNIETGSIRLEGELFVTQDGSARCDNTTNCYYNFRTGIHGVIESISTQLGGSGNVIEYLQHTNRFLNMKECATKHSDDYFNGLDICELKVATSEQAKEICRGKVYQNSGNFIQDMDFSAKLQFCLNKVTADSFSLSNYNDLIKVSVSLARNNAFLCGSGVNSNSKYELKNLRLTYRTLPAQPAQPISARSYVSLKQTLQSNNINVSSRVPAVVSGVSVSFLQQSKENTPTDNNAQLEKPPAPSELRWSFNDATSNYITYSILDLGEMVELGNASLGGGYGKRHNQLQTTDQGGINSFILGADFNGMIDLRNQKFTMELKSAINSGIPVICFMFFHNVINF
mgnify:CR=1 FL=1|tara:strand:+ start:10050 stop:11165 length:1116 start_codon:yes stop_codon:yes gene_type:complete